MDAARRWQRPEEEPASGIRTISSAKLAALGVDVPPTGHEALVIASRLREDACSVTWSARDASGAPVAVRALRATATTDQVNAFRSSALTAKALHDVGAVAGLTPIFELADDGRSFVMPALTIGTALDLPVFGWELPRTLAFFVTIAKTVRALHDVGVAIGRWSASTVLLSDELAPVLACDFDADGILPHAPREQDFFAPELALGAVASASADIYVLGRILEFFAEEAESTRTGRARESGKPSPLVDIVLRATADDPAERYPTVEALIAAVEAAHEAIVASVSMVTLAHAPSTEPLRVPRAPRRTAANERRADARAAPRPPPQANAAPSVGTERAWAALSLVAPAAACVFAYQADPSPEASGSIAWLAAVVSAIGVGLAARALPVTRRAAACVGALLAVALVTPSEHLAALGVEARLTGPAAARSREVDVLLRRGRKTFTGLDLSGFDLARRNLANVDLSGTNLERANLEHADLRGAMAVDAHFDGAILDGADLREAFLDSARGLDSARCNDSTRLPNGWACVEARVVREMAEP